MQKHNDFTRGPIAGPLIMFALPVMGAMVLQSLYGAVDLMIVGKYGSAADVSAVSIFIAWASFFRGYVFTGLFTPDPQLVAAAWDYLKAYAIDTLLTSVMFCFVGYFNGCGATGFVMAQGIVSAFCVRIPVSWLASRVRPVSLFRIGLATPASTALQIVLCVWYYYRRKKRVSSAEEGAKNL